MTYKTGLNPWHDDRITCICAKDSDGQRFDMIDEDERIILHGFFDWLHKHPHSDYILVTHNGTEFDMPFIMARSVVCDLYKVSNSNFLLNYEHFDTAKIPDKRVSLNNLAKLFGCKLKTGTGKNAIKLWNEKRFAELKEYCANDVDVTEEVYLKHKILIGEIK